jgi:hypothetical protein
MGPAFSLALLLIIGLGAVAISYGAARIFVPSRAAAIVAFGFVVGAAFGALLAVIANWLFGPREELTSSSQVVAFFSQIGVAAAIFGAACSRVFYLKFIPKYAEKKAANYIKGAN